MTDQVVNIKKDLGLQRRVEDALPYKVVGETFVDSFDHDLTYDDAETVLNHIVEANHQLKILKLRVCTQNTNGAKFSIYQTNPSSGEDGYPAPGSTPEGIRDFPMVEAAGCEVSRGSLEDPVEVLEGSIDFRIHGPIDSASAADSRYIVSWFGVEKIPEPE